jgi:hypothetical protein
MEFHSFLNLLADGFAGITIGRIERIIEAKGATFLSAGTVPVGAGESRINSHLLNPASEYFFQVIRVGIESAIISPGVHHSAERDYFTAIETKEFETKTPIWFTDLQIDKFTDQNLKVYRFTGSRVYRLFIVVKTYMVKKFKILFADNQHESVNLLIC